MLSETVAALSAARQAIWENEPADIARLRTRKGTRQQGASAILYATAKLGQLTVFLNHLRGVVLQNPVELETVKVITESLLEFYAAQYGGFYQLTDTAHIVRQAKHALAHVQSAEEYVRLIGELALYVGRVDYWVDYEIPWAQFGECFEQNLAHPD